MDHDIRDFINSCIPDISENGINKICSLIDKGFPIHIAIKIYESEKRAIMWDKSKDKNYYKVRMTNGGTKYVYMCKEAVEHMYIFDIIKEVKTIKCPQNTH